MKPQILAWLQRLATATGIHGTLFTRMHGDDTTFMEVFADVDCAAAERIEELARQQAWCQRLLSPRHVEIFTKEQA